jgi:hypothetical protein
LGGKSAGVARGRDLWLCSHADFILGQRGWGFGLGWLQVVDSVEQKFQKLLNWQV